MAVHGLGRGWPLGCAVWVLAGGGWTGAGNVTRLVDKFRHGPKGFDEGWVVAGHGDIHFALEGRDQGRVLLVEHSEHAADVGAGGIEVRAELWVGFSFGHPFLTHGLDGGGDQLGLVFGEFVVDVDDSLGRIVAEPKLFGDGGECSNCLGVERLTLWGFEGVGVGDGWGGRRGGGCVIRCVPRRIRRKGLGGSSRARRGRGWRC